MLFPEPPDGALSTEEQVYFRYPDFTQQGRLVLPSLMHPMGRLVWDKLLKGSPLAGEAAARGVVAILTRLIFEGGRERLSFNGRFTGRAQLSLGHTRDAAGEVNRLLLSTWCTVEGAASTSHLDWTPGTRRAAAGRVFGEHVWTRPFGPPSERKVLRFDLPGIPPVPPPESPWHPPEALLEPPEGARPLDGDLSADAAPMAWGLVHTDANQHVNSLVYPRVFEEACLRRLAALGRSTEVHCEAMELRFRKPCFAGERARAWVRLFDGPAGPVAAGGIYSDDERRVLYCTARAWFGLVGRGRAD